MNETSVDFYTVRVARGVVETIIRLAAAEVPDVCGFADERPILAVLRRPRPSGGIHLAVEEGMATINLSLVLKKEAEMTTVCTRVQQAVAEAVSNLVGLPVREVNVYVQDVR